MREEILKVIEQAEEIAGSWNGDFAGLQEDRAMIALEIVNKCNKILKLTEELED